MGSARQETPDKQGSKLFAERIAPMRRELLGMALLVISLITILTLTSVTSGVLGNKWAGLLRTFFGWGAIPVTIGLGWLGIILLLDAVRLGTSPSPSQMTLGSIGDISLRWDVAVILEVLTVAGLALLHIFVGGDDPLQMAKAGEGGGLLGWAISHLLSGFIGSLLAGGLLCIVCLFSLGLLVWLASDSMPQWIQQIAARIKEHYRRAVAALQKPVAPEPHPREQTIPGPKRRTKPVVSPEITQIPIHSEEEEPTRQSRRSKHLPSLDLLNPSSAESGTNADVRYQAQIIEDTLQGFGVPAKVREINVGPAVTQFGVEPGYVERRASDGEVRRQRVRVRRITALVNDLALALSAAPIRIEAPVPGRPVVGIEVPNSQVTLVSLHGMLSSDTFRKAKGDLLIPLGRDVSGEPIISDLDTMPHLLIAGATGSGKSVCINAIVAGLLMEHSPDTLKLLMIDPKMVELINYGGLPHLLAPVVVDLDQVVGALAWVTRIMDERYRLFSEMGARNVKDYNKKVGRQRGKDPLPHIVVIIDELADLMMMAPDEVERYITRIAQMARATGIHMVIATQRPSVDVVTGLIKANFPARVAFAVTSQIDSRVILDSPGAERLLGKGDSLLMLPDSAKLRRLQGCFVSDEEIHQIVEFWKENYGELPATVSRPWDGLMDEEARDDMFESAVEVVVKTGRASTTHLQRQLGIGYPRAARIMDQLEAEGIIGPAEGSRPREVLWDSSSSFEDSLGQDVD